MTYDTWKKTDFGSHNSFPVPIFDYDPDKNIINQDGGFEINI